MGTAALAGCSGGGGDETTEETTEDGGSDSTTTSDSGSDGGSEMGDAFAEQTYMNNPANYNPARHDAINLIGDQLNQAGVPTSVEVFEWGTLYNKITQELDFSFATWSRGLGIDPGRRMPEQFHSSNTDPGQGNFTGYSNEDLDPVLMEQLQETDVDARIDMLFEIQEVVNRDVPMHPIVQMPNIVAYNENQVEGWNAHLSGFYHFEPMTEVEVTNDAGELRGTWPETLGTLNVLGYNNETKLIHQFEMLYDKLVRINRNLEADPELSLATEWSREGATDITYTIREGHKWHDGEDVTPEDVKFTLEYIKENEIPLYSAQWEMYDSVEVDGQDVTVNFSDPVGPVNTLFSNQIPILPKHKWEGRSDPANMQVREPVGSGPLMFDYWDQGSELGLSKYEDHWRPVNFNRRIWRIIPESSTVWSLLKQGELNYLPFTRLGKQLSDNQDAEGIGVQSAPGDGWWHFSQNTRLDELSDPKVRQACVSCVPKTAINKQLLYGFARPGWNLVGESFGQFSNPDVATYPEGTDAAKQALRDAGYVFDDDGMVHFPAN